MSFKFYNKVVVGCQNRSDTYTGKLGFIVPEEGSRHPVFTSWIDKSIPLKELDNIPRTGFVFNKNITGDSDFSYRSTKFRIFHPDGFEFEISPSNLCFIMERSSIIAQEIMEPCVLAWFRNQVHLVPTNSKEYQEYIKKQKQLNSVDNDKLVIGQVFTVNKKHNLIYLGDLEQIKFKMNIGYHSSNNIHYQQTSIKTPTFYSTEKECFIHIKTLKSVTIEECPKTCSYSLNELLDFYTKISSIKSAVFKRINLTDFVINELKLHDLSIKSKKEKIDIFTGAFDKLSGLLLDRNLNIFESKNINDLQIQLFAGNTNKILIDITPTITQSLDLNDLDKISKLLDQQFRRHSFFVSEIKFKKLEKRFIIYSEIPYSVKDIISKINTIESYPETGRKSGFVL